MLPIIMGLGNKFLTSYIFKKVLIFLARRMVASTKTTFDDKLLEVILKAIEKKS